MLPDLTQHNAILKEYGLGELAITRPEDCIAQKKNARYFTPEKFQQLVNNIKRDGHLESVPLVCRTGVDGKYSIISGHHRIDAAKEAGLAQILVLVTTPKNRDELVSKQLAHNALVGKDDAMILAELFTSIADMDLRLASGLNDEAAKLSYASLNFRIGEFKEMVLMFLPEQLEDFEAGLTRIAETSLADKHSTVHVASLAHYERFAATLRHLKKVENIKNNATAVLRMAELAELQLAQINEGAK
jgi:hypothetical protein